MTFSTFEPYHRGIQDFKLTRVVGTFIGEARKGLDRDLVSTRGYGLDTLAADRSSPELAAALIRHRGVDRTRGGVNGVCSRMFTNSSVSRETL